MGCRVTLQLSGPSEREAEAEVDGIRVGININCREIVVDGIQATSAEDARQTAIEVATKFLDVLCSLHDYCLFLGFSGPAASGMDNVSSALIEDEGGAITYTIQQGICARATLRFGAGEPSDSWKLGAISGLHLPTMAQFRSGKYTSDIFHKYIDFYLAIESAAKVLHPHEQSGSLLEKALGTVYGNDLPLLCRQAECSGLTCAPTSAVADVKGYLWNDRRIALLHQDADALDRSNPEDVEKVRRAIPLVEAVARQMIRAAVRNRSLSARTTNESIRPASLAHHGRLLMFNTSYYGIR